jgi:hypothetical protein
MKTRLVLLPALLLMLSAVSPPAPAAADQRGGRAAVNRPRANQGRIPRPPVARTNAAEKPRAEHFPSGHVNDLPHVNHDRWFGHESPNDPRFHLDHPFERGRFAHFGPGYRYRVTRIDPTFHRFWLPGGFWFQVAPADWSLCEDWCWDCGDDFVIYEDPDHPGWYLVYNVYTGVYVHAQYMGT